MKKNQTKILAEDLISWRQLSFLLTGTPDRIRKDRPLPEEHKDDVNNLLDDIEAWMKSAKKQRDENRRTK